MNSLIRLDQVSKRFPNGDVETHALQSVDFELAPGEFVAVIGRSGSGKSTLLNVCAGIERADGGSVEVAGRSLTDASAHELADIRRKHIGVVFQSLNLLPSLTAIENVSLPLELGGERVSSARESAAEALAKVGLSQRGEQFPDQLSGGERQRVAIARAVVGERRILLADEPTGALDERTGDEVLSLLQAQTDAGVGVVMVTHDSALAALADRVIEIRDGQIVSTFTRPDADLELSEVWS